jgi:glycosyltransferase involved in cell wall biosynthesis
MQVGIDITSVIYNRGVSRYTSNLVRALLEQKKVQLALYGSSLRQADTLEKTIKAWKKEFPFVKFESHVQKNPPSLQEHLWNTFHLNPIKKIFPRLDVFHSWDWLQPPDKNLPLVSTVHDLAILKFPETAHPKILRLHQQAWKVLKERNAQIIAVSHATKKDLVELLEFAPENIHVIHEALPQETVTVSEKMTEEECEAIKAKLKLERPYIFFVGTREPRKNLMKLIEAWEPLSEKVDLLIAGESGWDETESQNPLLQNPHLRFLGKVSDAHLSVLYGEAEVFVYPSIYEGFGLPILEAFYHGTPVVTSNISSMPEVAGNAAELVNPNSVKSIREGIEKVLNEKKEAQQKRLQQMILRLQLFSWAKVADKTVEVYQRAAEKQV